MEAVEINFPIARYVLKNYLQTYDGSFSKQFHLSVFVTSHPNPKSLLLFSTSSSFIILFSRLLFFHIFPYYICLNATISYLKMKEREWARGNQRKTVSIVECISSREIDFLRVHFSSLITYSTCTYSSLSTAINEVFLFWFQ